MPWLLFHLSVMTRESAFSHAGDLPQSSSRSMEPIFCVFQSSNGPDKFIRRGQVFYDKSMLAYLRRKGGKYDGI